MILHQPCEIGRSGLMTRESIMTVIQMIPSWHLFHEYIYFARPDSTDPRYQPYGNVKRGWFDWRVNQALKVEADESRGRCATFP